ncbi:hypothetical protein C6502_15760 [Candidatus Poribacteria bacterium]|nr:MAG: hypothetical protein C6502_15760 [Candidatus Poribacteria bacterium]
MKHICWILFVTLFGIGICVRMGLASKEPIAKQSSPVLPLLEKPPETFQRTSFRLSSAVGTQIQVADQSELSAIEKHQGPLNLEPIKSPTKAFLYSALVPGSGQLYIGAKRGYLQIAAEVGLVVAYFITRSSAQNLREEYREQVRDNIVFEGPTKIQDWDPIEDFEHATQYENWNHRYDSEPTRARTGKWYWKRDGDAFKDRPADEVPASEARLEAFETRMDANDKFQLAKTFLGIAILNHVVSAVDARIAAKSYNKKHRSLVLDLQTSFSPQNIQGQLVLQKRF